MQQRRQRSMMKSSNKNEVAVIGVTRNGHRELSEESCELPAEEATAKSTRITPTMERQPKDRIGSGALLSERPRQNAQG